ncbi:MAG: hypothetical protein J2P53_04135, partial [Bradyrhizobiaceae bacterium]|nr:hypothetical protein [Bradyrhizobiaceae bacterium]
MRPLQLASLIRFDAPLADIEAGLATLGWGSKPVVTLTREHIKHILQRFASGEIDAATVEAWANLVEGRDDIQFEHGHEQVVADVVFDLANPVLQGKL